MSVKTHRDEDLPKVALVPVPVHCALGVAVHAHGDAYGLARPAPANDGHEAVGLDDLLLGEREPHRRVPLGRLELRELVNHH